MNFDLFVIGVDFIIFFPKELEDALLLDSSTTPSKLMSELFRTFLNGIIDTDIK